MLRYAQSPRLWLFLSSLLMLAVQKFEPWFTEQLLEFKSLLDGDLMVYRRQDQFIGTQAGSVRQEVRHSTLGDHS